VAAGDLVKVRIRTPVDPVHFDPATEQQAIAWIWVGQEPWHEQPMLNFRDSFRYGYLGSPAVRRTLIGRQLDEHFTIERMDRAAPGEDQLPERGIGANDRAAGAEARVMGATIRGQYFEPHTWPVITLEHAANQRTSAEIVILNICKAHLLRRQATLTQVGNVVRMFARPYARDRQGILGWTAIDAVCPAPAGQFRVIAGPFYYVDPTSNPQPQPAYSLYDWQTSYLKLRPPEKNAEEWEPFRDEGGQLIFRGQP
jgi:hypothetical protein